MSNLIFHIGMHMGEDLAFYLKRDERVIAVDADPLMVELAQRKFNKFIDANQLVLVNKAISNSEDQLLNFSLSNNTLWNSLVLGIASRKSGFFKTIQVESTSLPALISKFGVPYYCKIDIEGMDNMCLQSFTTHNTRPQFISVETECVDDKGGHDDSLKTLYSLAELGYTKFLLIDQSSLEILKLNVKFYIQKTQFLYYLNRGLSKFKYQLNPSLNRDKLSHKFSHYFPDGSSGPYGHLLDDNWYNLTEAIQLLNQHRQDYFKLRNASPFGFWCDWHATT